MNIVELGDLSSQNFDLEFNKKKVRVWKLIMIFGLLVLVAGLILALFIPSEPDGLANPVQTFELIVSGAVGIPIILVGYISERKYFLINDCKIDLQLSTDSKKFQTWSRTLLIAGVFFILFVFSSPPATSGSGVVGIILITLSVYFGYKVNKEKRLTKLRILTKDQVQFD